MLDAVLGWCGRRWVGLPEGCIRIARNVWVLVLDISGGDWIGVVGYSGLMGFYIWLVVRWMWRTSASGKVCPWRSSVSRA